jgi:hypothetical protein
MEKHKNEFIKRTKRRDNFVVIGNEVIQDSRMTIEARGVLVYLLSLPQDWVIRKNDLQKRLAVSRRTIDRCFEEMKQCGYLCETDFVKKDGKFDGKGYLIYDYSIYKNAPEMYSTDAHGEQRNDDTDAHGEHRTDAHGEHLIKNTDIQQRNKNNPPLSPKGENVRIDYKGLDKAVAEWLEYKAEKKQKYAGVKSIQTMINRLWKISKGNPEKAMEIVETSMAMNYQGFFEPKENNFAAAPAKSTPPRKAKVKYFDTDYPDRVKVATREEYDLLVSGNPDSTFEIVYEYWD